VTHHTLTAPRCRRPDRRLLALAALAALAIALLPGRAAAQGPAFPVGDLTTTRWDMAPVGDLIVYAGEDGDAGTEPWCADASARTSFRLIDVVPGAVGSRPQYFTPAGDYAYFFANDDASGGYGLWRTDCTVPGTVLTGVFAVQPYGAEVGLPDGSLVFTAFDSHLGYEPWVSDGTAAGTVMLKDIAPGGDGSSPDLYAHSGGVVYFVANDRSHGEELWVTDGTEAGTRLVKDIYVGSGSGSILGLADLGGKAIFMAYSGGAAIEVWQSDGTAAGTRALAPLVDLTEAWWWYYETVSAAVVGDAYYIFYMDPAGGLRMWISDGTAAGTHGLEQLESGDGRMVLWGQAADHTLYYPGYSTAAGSELWRTDGTAAGTRMVKDVNPGTANGTPGGMVKVRDNGLWLFSATTATGGVELWATDGTEAGTVLWQDIVPGEESSNPTDFVLAGHFVYFSTGSQAEGYHLWAVRVEPPDEGMAFFPDVRS
jgi:ELWxxDGT repeat protein